MQSKTRCKATITINNGGATRDRTADLLNAIQALSQLSYSPIKNDIVHDEYR